MIVSSGVPVESDVAVLRRIVKRERRAWHLSAFAEFVQARRSSGWLTAPMPVSPEDVGHCVAMACARARWTRARTIALWAVRALERRRKAIDPDIDPDKVIPFADVPPGSSWLDVYPQGHPDGPTASVGCRWPSADVDGLDASYASSPLWSFPRCEYAAPQARVLVTGLTSDECEWIGDTCDTDLSRARAEHLQAGGTIESWPGDES